MFELLRRARALQRRDDDAAELAGEGQSHGDRRISFLEFVRTLATGSKVLKKTVQVDSRPLNRRSIFSEVAIRERSVG